MMMRNPILLYMWGTFSLMIIACGPQPTAETSSDQARYPLPKMGAAKITDSGDTIPYQIPAFGFVDQDSNLITEALVDDKIYVVDFFFTTCPTICPKMSQQMVRVHDEFLEEDRVVLISHTIDPGHDTVEVLKAYAEALDVTTERWHMVTGEQDSLYNMARYYMVPAQEDADAPGGYIHSGAFILLDGNRHVRGFYDGTKPEEVDEMMEDMRWLLSQPG
jgi:protein SCO1